MLYFEQSEPGSNDTEGALHIPQSSSINETSSSDYLCLIQNTCSAGLGGSYLSAEIQSVYSITPAD